MGKKLIPPALNQPPQLRVPPQPSGGFFHPPQLGCFSGDPNPPNKSWGVHTMVTRVRAPETIIHNKNHRISQTTIGYISLEREERERGHCPLYPSSSDIKSEISSL